MQLWSTNSITFFLINDSFNLYWFVPISFPILHQVRRFSNPHSRCSVWHKAKTQYSQQNICKIHSLKSWKFKYKYVNTKGHWIKFYYSFIYQQYQKINFFMYFFLQLAKHLKLNCLYKWFNLASNLQWYIYSSYTNHNP